MTNLLCHQSWHLTMLRQAGRIAVVFVATLVAGVAAQPVQAGSYKVLHVFKGGNDGASPESSLILDAAGNPYGVTAAGGASGCNGGCGTVFKLDITGKETILYTFTGGADGAYPSSPLSVDANGTFAKTGPPRCATKFVSMCCVLCSIQLLKVAY